jgi:enoyl-CoA hydratase/carnithine racemase
MAQVDCARSGSIATITLNRPERRNALSIEMMRELGRLLREIEVDREIRALILAAQGNVFCSGLDLGAMDRSPADPVLETALVDEVLIPLERLPVPTIAAMNGDALAGGCELALHCDLRIAVPSARLGMPVARIGIVVPYPLILKLIETVGAAVTSELLFSAEPLSAERAHALAMVNRLVPADQLAGAARSLADAIAANAPLAVQAMKRAILAGRAQRDLSPEAVKLATERARSSADAREGLRAVLEKRKPVFRGE